jgi:hypothetical protein
MTRISKHCSPITMRHLAVPSISIALFRVPSRSDTASCVSAICPKVAAVSISFPGSFPRPARHLEKWNLVFEESVRHSSASQAYNHNFAYVIPKRGFTPVSDRATHVHMAQNALGMICDSAVHVYSISYG